MPARLLTSVLIKHVHGKVPTAHASADAFPSWPWLWCYHVLWGLACGIIWFAQVDCRIGAVFPPTQGLDVGHGTVQPMRLKRMHAAESTQAPSADSQHQAAPAHEGEIHEDAVAGAAQPSLAQQQMWYQATVNKFWMTVCGMAPRLTNRVRKIRCR